MSIEIKVIETNPSVPVGEMQDGDVGVIVAWTINTHIGTVVQMVGKALRIIGQPEGKGWSNAGYWATDGTCGTCKVRLLTKATFE